MKRRHCAKASYVRIGKPTVLPGVLLAASLLFWSAGDSVAAMCNPPGATNVTIEITEDLCVCVGCDATATVTASGQLGSTPITVTLTKTNNGTGDIDLSTNSLSLTGPTYSNNFTITGVTASTNLFDTKVVATVTGEGGTNCVAEMEVTVLKVDITDEADNVLESVQTNSVGEEISLKSKTEPAGLTGWTYQWTIPGTAVTNYIIAADDSSAISYPLNASHKTNVKIAFYWVDGATNRDVKLEAAYGGITCEDILSFEVQRPSVTDFESFTGPVSVDEIDSELLLLCGNAGTNGIDYDADVTADDFAGTLKFTQLTKHDIQVTDTNNATESLKVPTWWLDTEDPANGTNWSIAASASETPWGNDSPGVVLLPGDKKMDVKWFDFQLFLMFKPTNVVNSIWVPLQRLNWGWQGIAESTNGGLTWTLTSGSHDATNPVGSATLDFPEWSAVRTTNNPTWTSP